MKKTKKENKSSIKEFFSKRIKLGKISISYGTLLEILSIIVIILIACLSPKYYSVTTGLYNQGTQEQNEDVIKALGEDNTEERFYTYFMWYNVIHELGHGMIIYNGDVDISSAEEEQLVNEFAVAYWKYYGEEEKLELLEDITYYAINNIEGLDDNSNYLEYGKEHWNDTNFHTFNGYGWFQFNSTYNALKSDKTLSQVLDEMGVKNYEIPDEITKNIYGEINEEVSTEILNDAVDNFHSWGLYYPKIRHTYSKNPNNNFSMPMIKLGGLIYIVDYPKLFASYL